MAINSLITSASNVSDPAALATNLAGSSWNDWAGSEAPWIQQQVDKGVTAGDSLYGNSVTQGAANSAAAQGLKSDYANTYQPAGAKYGAYVDNLGTEGYRQQQRGQAMGDVQQQIDAQRSQQQRNLERQGVNPGSGRALAMSNQMSIAGAAAKAGAAGLSDRNTYKDYSEGLKTMTGMGLDTLKASTALDSSAQGWNKFGLDASKSGANLGMDYGKLSADKVRASGGVAAIAATANNNAATTAANIAQNADNNNPLKVLGSAFASTALKPVATSFGNSISNTASNLWGAKPTPTAADAQSAVNAGLANQQANYAADPMPTSNTPSTSVDTSFGEIPTTTEPGVSYEDLWS